MKNFLLIICILLFSHVIPAAANVDESDEKLAVVIELGEMAGRDQAIRFELSNAQSKGLTLADIQKKTSIIKLMEKIDIHNSERLKAIIKKYDWPGIKTFGAVTYTNAFLIVQHAVHDLALQETILKKLEVALKNNDALPSHYALLWDRVHDLKKQKQLYGTQGRCVGFHKWQPIPIEDPSKLNERRRQLGLEPYDQYLSIVSKFCY